MDLVQRSGRIGLLFAQDLVSVPSGCEFLDLQTKDSILEPFRSSMEPASYKHPDKFGLLLATGNFTLDI